MSWTTPVTAPGRGWSRPSQPDPWVWTVPRIADATKYGATVENATATQDSAGAITVDLNGGAALDITTGLAFSWPLVDLLGAPYAKTAAAGYLNHVLQVLLEEGSGGPDTLVDDLLWGVAISDAQDPSAGGATGTGVGVAFTGSNRKLRAFSWTNGGTYAESIDATNDALSVTVCGTFAPYSGPGPIAIATGIDAAGEQLAGQAAVKECPATFSDAAQCYLVLFFGRSSADASTIGGAVTLGYMASPPPFGGYTL